MQLGIKIADNPLVDIFLPPACIVCQAPLARMDGICHQCWNELQFIQGPVCQRTGYPMPYDLGENTLSLYAQINPPPYKMARAAFVYEGMARRLIIRMKFGDHPEIAPYLATFMTRAGSEIIAESDMLIPVPLHPLRLLMRRFNQAAELARAISNQCKRPLMLGVLKRSRWTQRQLGLSRYHRRQNLRNAFIVPHRQSTKIKNKNILLIDDVLTTGSTAEACTRVLLRAGATQVTILTAARVNLPEPI